MTLTEYDMMFIHVVRVFVFKMYVLLNFFDRSG